MSEEMNTWSNLKESLRYQSLEKKHADLIEMVCMVYLPLIKDLAESLGYHNLDHLQDDLIQRAQEATKDAN